jgi:hypothetical protein
MKLHIVPLLAGVILFSTALLHAQDNTGVIDPGRKAAADKLLRTLKVDQNMKMALQQVEKMQEQMIEQQVKSPQEKTKAEAAMKVAMQSTEEEFSWDKIGQTFVEIYAEVFTKDELDELTQFYESPIGQKFVEKQPQLQAATMKRMQSLMMEIMPRIQARVKEAMAEAGDKAGAAAPTE